MVRMVKTRKRRPKGQYVWLRENTDQGNSLSCAYSGDSTSGDLQSCRWAGTSWNWLKPGEDFVCPRTQIQTESNCSRLGLKIEVWWHRKWVKLTYVVYLKFNFLFFFHSKCVHWASTVWQILFYAVGIPTKQGRKGAFPHGTHVLMGGARQQRNK